MADQYYQSQGSEDFINFSILWEKKVFKLINDEIGNHQKSCKFNQSISSENFKNRIPILSLIKISKNYQKLSTEKFKEIIKLSWKKPLIINNSLVSPKIMNID